MPCRRVRLTARAMSLWTRATATTRRRRWRIWPSITRGIRRFVGVGNYRKFCGSWGAGLSRLSGRSIPPRALARRQPSQFPPGRDLNPRSFTTISASERESNPPDFISPAFLHHGSRDRVRPPRQRGCAAASAVSTSPNSPWGSAAAAPPSYPIRIRAASQGTLWRAGNRYPA